MPASVIDIVFAFLAGGLTILSPCVLPLIPVVALGSRQAGPAGPVWLLSGLTLSFVALTTVLLTVLTAASITQNAANIVGGGLLMLAGFIMAVPSAERRVSPVLNRISSGGLQTLNRLNGTHKSGQFFTGVLLGLIWSPCVGPSVGAGMGLIAKSTQPLAGIGVLFAYNLGLGAVLFLVGLASGKLPLFRRQLGGAGAAGKKPLGICLMLIGLLAITGWDKILETSLGEVWPDWAQNLSTAF